jgi:putative membrane protein
MKRSFYILLLCSPFSSVFAHTGVVAQGQLLSTWSFRPVVVLSLGVLGSLYWLGLAEMKEAGTYGHALRKWEVWSFCAGFAALILALLSPLDASGGVLFSAHMTQHEILMLVAAPLLILGRPLPVVLKAFPGTLKRALLRLGRTVGWLSGGLVTNAFAAWLLHALVLWIWHLPKLFNATLKSDFVHALQHISFFGSALLFWWTILDGRHKRLGYGVAVLYLFTTALHNSVLGALLTFSRDIWYPAYLNSTQSWRVTPLEDQQLGGLIMWIPASLSYIIAALVLFAGWLRESENRTLPTFTLEEKIA